MKEFAALQQVLEAMTEVSKGAMLFAVKVGETDRITANMGELARQLTELIGKYKVEEDDG